jgi:hypothetical protein
MTVEERFWAKVRKGDGCWEWNAAKRLGYGKFAYEGKVIDAHRLSWLLHFGPIPEGMLICHRCDNPPCVRPDHLFLGTRADNTHDMDAKGRRVRYFPPPPIACKRGHVYDAANTYMWGGMHHCRACRRDYHRQLRVNRRLTA